MTQCKAKVWGICHNKFIRLWIFVSVIRNIILSIAILQNDRRPVRSITHGARHSGMAPLCTIVDDGGVNADWLG